jgi:hypothetical protein
MLWKILLAATLSLAVFYNQVTINTSVNGAGFGGEFFFSQYFVGGLIVTILLFAIAKEG